MKKRYPTYHVITLFIILFSVTKSFSQVGIGNTDPNSSTLLEIGDGTDSAGLLVPRVALSAANVAAPVVNPANSLFIYNTATNLSAAGYINDVRPGFYSWDSSLNRWITQTKETRMAKWKSTNTTEKLNNSSPVQVNLFGTEIFNDDSNLFVVTTSNTEDEVLIKETGRYEVSMNLGFRVTEDDKYNEIVVKVEMSLNKGGTYTYPGVSLYGYINDDDKMVRTSVTISDIIEIEENTLLSIWASKEVDSGDVYIANTGAAVLTIRKLE